FYKALSAIRIAEELTATGIDAVPVFWMATEDHDLDEVRHVSFFKSGKLTRFELSAGSEAGRPVGRVQLGGGVDEITKAGVDLLAGTASGDVARFLQQSYRPEEIHGSAFGKLFARVFADQGLILLDPLDARLHQIAAPVYRQALEDRDQLNEKLLRRGKELEVAGYEPQVKVGVTNTLLFHIKDNVRQPIVARNEPHASGGAGGFKSGEITWTREEALRLAESAPEAFSPNALLRPVLQDYLLPTVAFSAGSSEI